MQGRQLSSRVIFTLSDHAGFASVARSDKDCGFVVVVVPPISNPQRSHRPIALCPDRSIEFAAHWLLRLYLEERLVADLGRRILSE